MMRRFHVRQEAKKGRLSTLEKQSLLIGVGLIVAAPFAAVATDNPAEVARFLASAGLAVLLLCATLRAVAHYRAGATASLPRAVGRVSVRIRPARGFGVAAVLLALVLPVAAGVTVLAVVVWSWLLVAPVVLIGCAALFVRWADAAAAVDCTYRLSCPAASELLERLCMRADIPVPELVVENDVVANAWTAGGRIHLTSELVDRLDQRELEAVLAHELAHLARRDAAVMEICSAPSGMLLGFAGLLAPRIFRLTKDIIVLGVPFQVAVLHVVPGRARHPAGVRHRLDRAPVGARAVARPRARGRRGGGDADRKPERARLGADEDRGAGRSGRRTPTSGRPARTPSCASSARAGPGSAACSRRIRRRRCG